MDALQVYLLGRRLMRIGETALVDAGGTILSTGARLILQDVAAHPDSTIGEITDRTGFPQSHVSATVARLRERDVVATHADPSDGRRTLVRATDTFRRKLARRAATPADEAFAAALGSSDPATMDELEAALAALSRLLLRQAGVAAAEAATS